MHKKLWSFVPADCRAGDAGAVALEYALTATLIAVAAATGVQVFGLNVNALLTSVIDLF